jgi:sulfite exporter TauE/SafE
MTGELAAITGPGTAFIAGLVTSLHCAGMCGPLACAVMPAARAGSDPQVVASAYHLTRLAGYTALGALAGGVGRWPLWLIGEGALRWLPWLLVVFLVATAFRFDQRLPRPPWLG